MDRAALDVARTLGLPCGGWCPKGRKAEDGRLALRYPLRETPTASYAQRTKWNVRDADGTLILTRGPVSGGTADTVACAVRLRKPYLVVDLDRSPAASAVRGWARSHRISTLNIAGPRESKAPGIYARAAAFLRQVMVTR